MTTKMTNDESSRSAPPTAAHRPTRTLRRLAGATAVAIALGGATLASPLGASEPAPTEKPGRATASAVFAGGCFWCMEKPFDVLPGVLATTAGYTGGTLPNPSYEHVASGNTQHIESVRIEYDPSVVSYATLVEVFWRNVDPLDARGQFCDKGHQYTSAIFYGSAEEKKTAEASKRALEESGHLPGPIATRIVPASEFYDAEEYHQDYYQKNPIRYRFYRHGCGRDARLQQLWGEEAGGEKVSRREEPAPPAAG